MPSTKTILATSVVVAVGGGLWALLKIYNYLLRKKRIIHRLHLKPPETAATSNKPLLNDTSSVFEKELDIPSYKGLYLFRYSKSTLSKYEVYSGAR